MSDANVSMVKKEELMGAGSDLVKAQLVAAAIDRHRAQALLEQGARDLAHFHVMRERQDAVNEADQRIAAAAEQMIRQFPAEVGH